jgi:hypothetical protein
VILSGSTFDDVSPVVVKLEDGFEKRYALRCKRCDVQIGYWLDQSQFDQDKHGRRTDVMYLLSDGLMSTDEMNNTKRDWEKEADLRRAAG